ncbi:Peroxisomal acyl-coenzyme A thioester hydrolase 1 [Candida viswanathii]|uniref:Peroxisomal acyl-coenzyme A thioester hydrolase 1 n=1 Tax=Candida viswanathii TaxID=5486 RepID=A0A367YM50_9ASCO|nr:Peroxisomal acyl-coenzyme A thioester hydrolase 1 [Candida viswanathii]
MPTFNYKDGETIDVQKEFGVVETAPNKYVGVKPLVKPMPQVKGVFGGNLAGQALLVAMKSAGPDFSPHSLHSYFIRAGSDQTPVEWTVQAISDGNSFCNRSIKGSQNGQVIYIANVSLTKRNSTADAMKKYEEYHAQIRQKGKDGDADDEDEDDDDEDYNAPAKPFGFQTPSHKWIKDRDLDKLPVSDMESNLLLYYKLPPEFVSLKSSTEEEQLPVSDRRMSALVKWGIENEQGFNQPLTNLDKSFQYVGLANITDGLYLGTLDRILRINDMKVDESSFNSFRVSLDHVIYFHDDDFDVTKWMGFTFRCSRYLHNRVIFEGEIYNDKGAQVASFMQEGIVKLGDGNLKNAKL